MVLANQYLERPTLIAREASGETITLEGLYHRGTLAPGVVICAPHPRLGGSMDSPVVAELAWALTRAGHATLRFNYQGVGASGGSLHAGMAGLPTSPLPLDAVREEAEDARAACRHLAECVEHRRVALVGYSFGCAVALSVAREAPDDLPLLLVAPPTRLFDFSSLADLVRPTVIALPHSDAFADRTRLQELAAPRAHLRLEVLESADHYFSRGLPELGRLAVRCFEEVRPSA